MDNDISSYQSLMNTDSTLYDISNILQQLQIIQAYFIQNPNYIIYSDGSSAYLKNSAIQNDTIDESKIINLTSDLGNKQPLSDILTKLSALIYTNNYYLQSTATGVQWTQITFSYLFSNFISDYLLYSQISGADNSDYSILTKKGWMSSNYPYFGSTSYMFCNMSFLGSSTTTNFNYYLISPSNLFSMVIETPQNANFNFIVNSQTTSQYKARIYFDKLATSTYLDFDQLLNAINITGTLRNNSSTLSASNAYEYITKYYSDLTYQSINTYLTAYINAGWGTNNYILKTNGTNAFSYVNLTSLYSDNTISYSRLIWQTQPSTINQNNFIYYDNINDKLSSSQYINTAYINDGTIAGAKITNGTISYTKLLTYNNPSDLQCLTYNSTQGKLQYTTIQGSLFSDNTIPYNKLGTKTNNYAFICTDSTHANIIEVLLNSTTNVNNYISSACIDYTRLTPINDTYTITSAYNGTFNINFNNTFSTTNNFLQHNIKLTNSTYGVKTYVWKYNAPNANYCTLDLLIDGVNNYFSCTGNTSGIYNGSTYNKGVIVSQWFKASNILSNNTSTSISSFAPYECLTKGVCEARYMIAGSPTTFGYNTNFVLRSEGYYFKTYAGSYSDHTYFISSYSNSSPGIGTSYTWSGLIAGGGSSNYICEFRTLASNSSTTAYINSSGIYTIGSAKKLKDNIINYDNIDKNDLDILDIIKNIKISIFDYSKKEKPQNEEIHDNFKRKLIIESQNETGVIIEDLEDYYKICKLKNKNKTCDIFDSMITYDHRLCDKQNDTLKCNTNDGQYCQKFLAYNGIYNLNVHATKQLINKVEELENKIIELTKLINNLMNKV